MKKGFVVLMAVGIIIGLSHGVFAFPGSVTVDSFSNGCRNYDLCDNPASPLSLFFEAGIYTFTVNPEGGAWSSFNSPDTSDQWTERHWFWSLYIYNPQTDTLYSDPGPTLGSNNDFLNEQEALNQFNQSNDSVTIDVGSSGDLWFYIKDRDEPGSARDNIGSVTADVVLVPEPVSTTLFILGGAVFAGRIYLRKRNKD
jgi:hypothetical protein